MANLDVWSRPFLLLMVLYLGPKSESESELVYLTNVQITLHLMTYVSTIGYIDYAYSHIFRASFHNKNSKRP